MTYGCGVAGQACTRALPARTVRLDRATAVVNGTAKSVEVSGEPRDVATLRRPAHRPGLASIAPEQYPSVVDGQVITARSSRPATGQAPPLRAGQPRPAGVQASRPGCLTRSRTAVSVRSKSLAT